MGHAYTCSRPQVLVKKEVRWEEETKPEFVEELYNFANKAQFTPDIEFGSEGGLEIINILHGIASATIFIHPYELAKMISLYMEEGDVWVYLFVQGEDFNYWSNTYRITPGKVEYFKDRQMFEAISNGEMYPEEKEDESGRSESGIAGGVIRIRCKAGPWVGAVFEIGEDEEVVIGRDPFRANIVIENLNVSREHALIKNSRGEMLFIRDLGSKNGTFLYVNDPSKARGDLKQVGSDGELINMAFPEDIVIGKGRDSIVFEVLN